MSRVFLARGLHFTAVSRQHVEFDVSANQHKLHDAQVLMQNARPPLLLLPKKEKVTVNTMQRVNCIVLTDDTSSSGCPRRGGSCRPRRWSPGKRCRCWRPEPVPALLPCWCPQRARSLRWCCCCCCCRPEGGDAIKAISVKAPDRRHHLTDIDKTIHDVLHNIFFFYEIVQCREKIKSWFRRNTYNTVFFFTFSDIQGY